MGRYNSKVELPKSDPKIPASMSYVGRAVLDGFITVVGHPEIDRAYRRGGAGVDRQDPGADEGCLASASVAELEKENAQRNEKCERGGDGGDPCGHCHAR